MLSSAKGGKARYFEVPWRQMSGEGKQMRYLRNTGLHSAVLSWGWFYHNCIFRYFYKLFFLKYHRWVQINIQIQAGPDIIVSFPGNKSKNINHTVIVFKESFSNCSSKDGTSSRAALRFSASSSWSCSSSCFYCSHKISGNKPSAKYPPFCLLLRCALLQLLHFHECGAFLPPGNLVNPLFSSNKQTCLEGAILASFG